MDTTFDGWPAEAPTLLAEIAADNRADRWPELRDRHRAAVRGPTLALAAELAAEFGPVRVFRPHVSRRFWPDAPPLRVDTGGVATSPGGCGLTAVLSASALTVTVGYWRFDRQRRARYRAAVAAPGPGVELGHVLRLLSARGLAPDPDGELRGTPRGWRRDHPRIGLARRRGLQVVYAWELGPWLATREPLERVRTAWHAAAPLVAWLDAHVAPVDVDADVDVDVDADANPDRADPVRTGSDADLDRAVPDVRRSDGPRSDSAAADRAELGRGDPDRVDPDPATPGTGRFSRAAS